MWIKRVDDLLFMLSVRQEGNRGPWGCFNWGAIEQADDEMSRHLIWNVEGELQLGMCGSQESCSLFMDL